MRSIFTCTIAALILTACSQTSITSTPLPEFTPTTKFTLTPRPTETPTPSPESLLPQEVKEKFELAGVDLAQMENAKYDKDGLHITLPDGEVIVLTNTDLQKGMYNGQDNVLQYRDKANQNVIYAFDKESGKWEPAQEIVTTPSGVGFELGTQIEGQPEGVREVVDIVPPNMWNAEKRADYEERIDPTTYGFAEGETRFVYIPTENGKYRVELQRTSDPADVIAVFGSNDFVWKISEMVDENGNPVFLNAGKLVEMQSGMPKNPNTTRSAASRMVDEFVKLMNNQLYHEYYLFISRDGKRGVQFNFTATDDGTDGKGYVYFRDKDGRTVRWLYVEDFDESISFVEAVH